MERRESILHKDAALNNTGFVAYQTRARMIDGVPDGFSETNSPGTNYVSPDL
jgi:hypothetical protein